MRKLFLISALGFSLLLLNTVALASLDSDPDTSVMEGIGWRTDIFSDFQTTAIIEWGQLLLQPDGKVVVIDTAQSRLSVNVGRLNSDGTLDTSFGNLGWMTSSFRWVATGLKVLLQTDGKIVVAASFNNGRITLIRFLTNGQLDTSFSDNGQVTIANAPYNYIYSLAQQSTGKLTIGTDQHLFRLNTDGTLDNTFDTAQQTPVGSHAVNSDDSLYVYDPSTGLHHFTANGVLDTTFGIGGTVTLPQFVSAATLIIANNKLWIGGFTYIVPLATFPGIVYRYNLNGTLDTSFDSDGYVTFNGSWSSSSPYTFVDGMVVNSNQEALLWYNNGSQHQAIRLLANGAVDTSFSGDSYYDDGANSLFSSMIFQSDRKILLCGWNQTPQGWIRRLNTDGSLDNTFAGDGEYSDLAKMGSTAFVDSVHLSNNKLLAVGDNGIYRFGSQDPPILYWPTNSSIDLNDFAQCVVAQYTASGEPDTSFGGTGHVLINRGYGCSLDAVKELDDGKYLAAGSSDIWWNGSYKALIVKLNTNGTLDTSFDTDGVVEVAADLVYYHIEQQSDHKILVIGEDDSGNGVVVRYNSNGSIDTTYASSGRLTLTGLRRLSSALQSDDKLLVYSLNGKLLRFNSNGTADSGFGTAGQITVNGIGNGYASDFAFGNWLLLKGDGKIVLMEATADSQFRLHQFTTSGLDDSSFGTAGITNLPDVTSLLSYPLMQTNDFRIVSLTKDQQGGIVLLGDAGVNVSGSYATQLLLMRYSPTGQLDQHLFAQSNGITQPILTGTKLYITDIHPDLNKGLWLTGTASTGRHFGAGFVMKLLGVADYDNDGIANDIDTDVDGDQLPDAWEIAHFGDLWMWNASSNPDGDGWKNYQEFLMNTDPNNADSDGDGINDDLDFNPLNPYLQSGNETLPLNGTYKGSVLQNEQRPQ